MILIFIALITTVFSFVAEYTPGIIGGIIASVFFIWLKIRNIKNHKADLSDRIMDGIGGAVLESSRNVKTNKKGKKSRNEAQEWLDSYKSDMAADTQRHHAKKQQQEQMLEQARQLENQLRYQSGWQANQTQKEIDRLKREAYRL